MVYGGFDFYTPGPSFLDEMNSKSLKVTPQVCYLLLKTELILNIDDASVQKGGRFILKSICSIDAIDLWAIQLLRIPFKTTADYLTDGPDGASERSP